MILLLECIGLCLIFYMLIIISYKKNPLSGVHNLPIEIQKRVQELPEYNDIKPKSILSTRKRIIKKIPALIVLLVIFAILVYLAGARNFIEGFTYSFIIWFTIKLFVVFVIDILWYSNSPNYWIKGTEDLESEYKNYKFYISSIPRSLIAGFIVSIIIGIIISIIG